jgi:hypothetical protein
MTQGHFAELSQQNRLRLLDIAPRKERKGRSDRGDDPSTSCG